ncbi:MAG TPA: hypothetical protein DCW46_00680 [Desulfotomaculum sp.]|nr:hypothetical protein [Desulfotomaculum sp.]
MRDMEKRRTYSAEEKANIVLQLLREERTTSQIAAETGIHPTVLARWKAEAIDNLPSLFTRGASETEKMRKQHEAEKEELTRQIGQLTIEVNWLKKNLQKSTSVEERREMLNRDYRKIPLKKQARLLDVNQTSAYYRPRKKEDTDIELMHRIDEIYTRWPHYGYRRITKELQDQNIPMNRKRVLRLMRRMGFYGICPGPNLSKRNHQHHTYP